MTYLSHRRKAFSQTQVDWWNDCVLLAHLDTNFNDSSPAASNLSAVGDAAITAAQSKWGAGSCIVDGTSDYMLRTHSTDIDFGTGDFAIDMWIRPDSISGNRVFFDTRETGVYTVGMYIIMRSGVLGCDLGNGGELSGSTAITVNTWNHVALSRVSGTLNLYLNGTREATGTRSGDSDNSQDIWIGQEKSSSLEFSGYIDEVRILKNNNAGWTGASITIPTSAYSQYV